MTLQDAFDLFRRLSVHPEMMSRADFSMAEEVFMMHISRTDVPLLFAFSLLPELMHVKPMITH